MALKKPLVWTGSRPAQIQAGDTLDPATLGTNLELWSGINPSAKLDAAKLGSTGGVPILLNPGEVRYNASLQKVWGGDGSGNAVLIGQTSLDINYQPHVTLFKLAAAHSNSSTTATRITDGTTPWYFPVTAGVSYRITVYGGYQTAATTTGAKLGLLGSGGVAGTIVGSFTGAISKATVATGLDAGAYSYAGGAGAFILTTSVDAINTQHDIGCDVIFNCTTSGFLELQFASEVAASAAQLNVGSVLLVQDLSPASLASTVATAYKTASQTLTTGVGTTMTWGAASPNDASMWSSGAPTRLTAPAGVSRVVLTAGVRFAGSAAGNRWVLLFKNGATCPRGFGCWVPPPGGNACDMNARSSVLDVSPGDYFELYCVQDSGGNLDVLSTGAGTYLSMEVVK